MEQSYEWVLKIIESCTTEWHFKTCTTVVKLFSDQYYDLGGPWTFKLWANLRLKAKQHGIEIPYNS